MAIIGMAVWDTVDNKRTKFTELTLLSLAKTVDWDRHRLIVSDNGSCPATHELYGALAGLLPFDVIYNEENIGTANAINLAWRQRAPGEHAVKMDNDVVVHAAGWLDQIEEVFERDPEIGICGLKRKDLDECPSSPVAWYKSTLRMLAHETGERWIIVEDVMHVMGTCQGYSSGLLDKIGYLYQMGGVYGFDDTLAAVRAIVAGYKCVFLPNIDIDHVDHGGDTFTLWKQRYAGSRINAFNILKSEYRSGIKQIHYDGGFGCTTA